jgi:hypothetical protein
MIFGLIFHFLKIMEVHLLIKYVILNHAKTIDFPSFIFFLDAPHHEEAKQKFS